MNKANQFDADVYSDMPNVPSQNIVGGYYFQAKGFYENKPVTVVCTEEDEPTAIGKAAEEIRAEVRKWGPMAKERFPDSDQWEIRVWRP